MALTLIATPGATNANTYATKAQASAVGGYLESRLFNTDWTSATVANRNVSLVQATRLLDDWFNWNGEIADDDQALRWPRYSVEDCDGVDIDSDIIPQFLIDATAELALHLLQGSDVLGAPDTLGFSRLKVDVLELEVDKSDRDSETVIPDSVMSMLECYGVVRSRGTGGIAQLIRA